MKNIKEKTIFNWAWEQREAGTPPEEARFTMSEALVILRKYSDPEASEKKLRDYERDHVITPERSKEGKSGHRLYSVSNILSLHLMLQGTKLFGKSQAKPIVELYKLSRTQPTRFNPAVFDCDVDLPKNKKIHDLLHEPLLKSPLRQMMDIVRMVARVDSFIHIHQFAKEHGICFVCPQDQVLTIKRLGLTLQYTPPLTEWRSVKKAREYGEHLVAEAKFYDKYPESPKDRKKFEQQINSKIIEWLLEKRYAVRKKSLR